MEFITTGIKEAFELIFSFDETVYEIVGRSLQISCTAIMLATIVGIPLGFFIGITNFKGKNIVLILLNTLYSLPTVIVGLFLYSMLSRIGPLGSFGLLFTIKGIIIGQFVLILPIVTALSVSATQNSDKRILTTATTLGANRRQVISAFFWESRYAYFSAILAGFGRAFGEVGVSMMIGGNIAGCTRNITTAIALQTSMGEFVLGFALGVILLFMALLINIVFQVIQKTKVA